MFPWWLWALLAIALVILLYLLWKRVQVPSISVSTDKSLYDRTETVTITGILVDQNSDPMPGKTVSPAITPPVGDAYVLPPVTTAADGSYSVTWEIPDDAGGGTYTVDVASLGATGTTTFTQSKWEVERLDVWVPVEVNLIN